VRRLVVVFLALTGCNAILDAGEPEVTNDVIDRDDPTQAQNFLCGNGVAEEANGEQCDDANEIGGDGCVGCKVECDPPRIFDPDTFHCYAIIEPPLAWQPGRDACIAEGASLAILSTLDELAVVQPRLDRDLWLGGEVGADGVIHWVDGSEQTDPKFWAPEMPDGVAGCLALDGEYLAFERGDCATALPYLCEREPAGF